MDPQTQFTDNREAQRYELRRGDAVVAIAQYRLEGPRVRFTHTEVRPADEAQGLGTLLARQALDDVRRQQRKAVPSCAFIAAFIERHPHYAELVDAGRA